jgi:hypothetical protein
MKTQELASFPQKILSSLLCPVRPLPTAAAQALSPKGIWQLRAARLEASIPKATQQLRPVWWQADQPRPTCCFLLPDT